MILHAACSGALPAMSPHAAGINVLWWFSEQLEKITEDKPSEDC